MSIEDAKKISHITSISYNYNERAELKATFLLTVLKKKLKVPLSNSTYLTTEFRARPQCLSQHVYHIETNLLPKSRTSHRKKYNLYYFILAFLSKCKLLEPDLSGFHKRCKIYATHQFVTKLNFIASFLVKAMTRHIKRSYNVLHLIGAATSLIKHLQNLQVDEIISVQK